MLTCSLRLERPMMTLLKRTTYLFLTLFPEAGEFIDESFCILSHALNKGPQAGLLLTCSLRLERPMMTLLKRTTYLFLTLFPEAGEVIDESFCVLSHALNRRSLAGLLLTCSLRLERS